MVSEKKYIARPHRREAALERAALILTTPWPEYDPKREPTD